MRAERAHDELLANETRSVDHSSTSSVGLGGEWRATQSPWKHFSRARDRDRDRETKIRAVVICSGGSSGFPWATFARLAFRGRFGRSDGSSEPPCLIFWRIFVEKMLRHLRRFKNRREIGLEGSKMSRRARLRAVLLERGETRRRRNRGQGAALLACRRAIADCATARPENLALPKKNANCSPEDVCQDSISTTDPLRSRAP